MKTRCLVVLAMIWMPLLMGCPSGNTPARTEEGKLDNNQAAVAKPKAESKPATPKLPPDDPAVVEKLTQAGGMLSKEEAGHITRVSYYGRGKSVPVSDADLEGLTKLPNLKVLVLFGRDVTDAGIEHIVNMKELRDLTMEKTQISDAGLAKLKESPKLSAVKLPYASITAEGIQSLVQLPKLRNLELLRTLTTDEGLAYL